MTAWAFVIGINDYPAETKLTKLHGAVADAADFADWALDASGGGVAPEGLYFWSVPAPVNPGPNLTKFMKAPTKWPFVGPDFTNAPKASEVMRALHELAVRAGEADVDRLYVFLAGHGAQTRLTVGEERQNCFIAGDFAPEMPALGPVGCDDMKRYLQMMGPPEILMFLDCCRTKLPMKVGKLQSLYNMELESGRHLRLGIGRAAMDEAVAYEVPGDAPVRGAFSKLLIGALREHRVDGKLTLKDLEDFVRANIGELVKPYFQTPEFDERPKPPPALTIVEGPPMGISYNLVIDFSDHDVGTQFVIRDETTKEVASGDFVIGPNVYSLPVGGYSIEIVGSDPIAFNHLGPGDTHVSI